EVPRFLNLGTAGEVNLGAKGPGEDVGQGGLPQSGGAAEEDVVQGVPPSLGGLDHEHEPLLDLGLTAELLEVRRAQALLKFPSRLSGGITGGRAGHDEAILKSS